MKKIVITFWLFSSLIAQAQIEPLLNTSWVFEKVTIGEEVYYAEPSQGTEQSISIDFTLIEEDNMAEFMFWDFVVVFFYEETEQSFTIFDILYTPGDNHPTIAYDKFKFDFLLIPNGGPYDWYETFTFYLEDTEEFTYLHITNEVGYVATFFTTTLSNTNFENVELSIYPNPTSNLLHIEASQTDISKVEIFDVQGKRVMQVNSTNLREVDVSQLTNGMYFLKVSTSDGELTRKFVKN